MMGTRGRNAEADRRQGVRVDGGKWFLTARARVVWAGVIRCNYAATAVIYTE